MTFKGHINKLKSKISSGIYALSTCSRTVPLRIRKSVYSCLVESHLRFGAIIYGAASPKYLEPISILQRKAIRLVANTKYNSHTDQLFKHFGFLKHSDIVHLDQTIFMKQYSDKQVPNSLQGLFSYISKDKQKCRGDDYNFETRQINSNDLLHYPNVQLSRSFNRNNIYIKSQGGITTLKQLFIREKLSGYENECTKPNCHVCRNV